MVENIVIIAWITQTNTICLRVLPAVFVHKSMPDSHTDMLMHGCTAYRYDNKQLHV